MLVGAAEVQNQLLHQLDLEVLVAAIVLIQVALQREAVLLVKVMVAAFLTAMS